MDAIALSKFPGTSLAADLGASGGLVGGATGHAAGSWDAGQPSRQATRSVYRAYMAPSGPLCHLLGGSHTLHDFIKVV